MENFRAFFRNEISIKFGMYKMRYLNGPGGSLPGMPGRAESLTEPATALICPEPAPNRAEKRE